MDQGVLPDVESGQMEPEALHPAQQAPNPEQPGVATPVALEAGGDQAQVGDKGGDVPIIARASPALVASSRAAIRLSRTRYGICRCRAGTAAMASG